MSDLATMAKEAGLTVIGNTFSVEGIDNMDQRDQKVGSIVLVQDALKVFIRKGIKAGSFVDTATESEIKNISFIPCLIQKRWFLTDNTETIPKCVGSSINEFDPMFEGKIRYGCLTPEQKTKKIKPEVYPGYAGLVIVDGDVKKIKFWKAAGLYAGQNLVGFAQAYAKENKLPAWSRKYSLTSKLNPPAHGNPDYYAMVVTPGVDTTAEERAYAKQTFDTFRAKVQPVEQYEEPPF